MSTPFSHAARAGRSRPHSCLILVVLILPILLLAGKARAQDWAGAEQELAAKILSGTSVRAITVEVTNRSSLSSNSTDEIRRGVLTQLAVLGARLVNAEQAAASVRVSLSEDLANYVWVAEIRQGTNEASVVMVSRPRPAAPAVEPEVLPMALHKTTLWSQQKRILDVALIDGNPQRMLVLDADGIAFYRLQDGRWLADELLAVSSSHPWPRDLRGRLILQKDHLFDVYLPATFCRSVAGTPLTMSCQGGDFAWPLGSISASSTAYFTSSRNFFSGTLLPASGKQTIAPPFYSSAELPGDKRPVWLLAAVDGQLHLIDGGTDQIVNARGWGSDIAAVRSGCGTGWQILATSAGDNPHDSVQAFEIPAREPVAVSLPLEISGKVTALWTESERTGAIAVAQNSDTGGYEAFRLTVSCGH